MTENQTFYYRFKRLNFWLALNISLIIIMSYGLICCPCLLYWKQAQVLLGITIFSNLAWMWLHLLKHKMAVVTDKYIKIDHNAPLYWKDISSAEEKTVRCGLRKCKIIALNPKDGIDYKYTFLQKHNCFPPFSIPLYGIVDDKDIEKIISVIKTKVKRADL